ncbi:MAG TPA: pyruvate dehydrogenase (acetyl-transferring) E1 component subunit alpha [Aridibacter sp.]|nr:pyruvate dehydrogenase (acetyl-transferring) E1 component subunit alpha [Aridibacter sp.]
MANSTTGGKTSSKTGTASGNGKKTKGADGGSDIFNPEKAQQEYNKRKKSQLQAIKKTDKEILSGMLYQMVLGRQFEQKCAEVYRIGKIGGFCHLYIGQEAIAIGVQTQLEDRDFVIGSYRDHVQAMVQGIPPESVMAELYGKADGNVGGKGGSMHMFSKEHNFFGGHGIVGGQIGVGTGLAFAQRYKETGGVVVCYFGEAAVNQGIFHESLNMAVLWKLPCIYICENNKYGMGTSQERATSVSSISSKADSYGIEGEFVDGMDVMAVRESARRAIERARNESLPTLLEVRAYRYMGHSMSDPGKYRSTEEIKKYQERDPIILFKDSLEEAGVLNEKDFEEIEKRADERVAEALEFAENSPVPDNSELMTDVLV